jgi:lipoprotein-anchoring transpeptidase ErfK/SrfK
MTEGDHGQEAQQGQPIVPGEVCVSRPRSRARGRAIAAVAALVVVSASLAAAGFFSGGQRAAEAPARPFGSNLIDPQRAIHPPVVLQQSPPASPPVVTLVARMKGTFPGYSAPDGRDVVTVAATWQGMPSALPVIATAPGWLRVRLPQRPDESTAWIRSGDAKLSTTPYRIVVNLKTTHLQLFKFDRLLDDFAAGVGAEYTPTPIGQYFVAFLEPPIGAEYGAFIMITSAHSRAIADWAGTGDAIIGIHGPIGADAEIGTTGAYVSNGCIRLHDADLLKLEDVPPGTPIDIVG